MAEYNERKDLVYLLIIKREERDPEVPCDIPRLCDN